MFSIFNVSGSAISAQAQRLNAVASNLANADTVSDANGQAYRAKQVIFQAADVPGEQHTQGVQMSQVVQSDAPGRRVYQPQHPSADGEGYVTYANVNPVDEMVNMIAASRSYQNNVEVMNTAKNLLMKTLQMGQ